MNTGILVDQFLLDTAKTGFVLTDDELRSQLIAFAEVIVKNTGFPSITAIPDFHKIMSDCDRMLKVKGNDYTQGADPLTREGRLKNFIESGKRLGMSPLKVLAIYMFKHVSAIETFIQKGQVESEPIEGRICDTINYLLLMGMLVEYMRQEAEKAKEQ